MDPVQNWNLNADFWDQSIGGNGNQYWAKLQEPCLQRFLGEQLKRDDCRALEFATGNGLCARWMAERGAQVLATDGAPNMLERAKARGSAGGKIQFRKIDVTADEELDLLTQVRANL
jgi:2-polyprenyl-3-methyl-5-hydroxy-6-metoxy-1,4-benzoquinol methylase